MKTLSVYDICLLYNHFEVKKDRSKEDQSRAAKLDDLLRHMVDTIAPLPEANMSVSEIFEKLTGEKLENYK